MEQLDPSALAHLQKPKNTERRGKLLKMKQWQKLSRNLRVFKSLSWQCLHLVLGWGPYCLSQLEFQPSLAQGFSVPWCHCKVKTWMDSPAWLSWQRDEKRVNCIACLAELHPVLQQGSNCRETDLGAGWTQAPHLLLTPVALIYNYLLLPSAILAVSAASAFHGLQERETDNLCKRKG